MSTDPAVNDLDGGYSVEVDARLDCYNQGDLNLQQRTPIGVPICVDTPDESAKTLKQLSFVKSLINAVEQDLYDRKSMERINPVSFADWYLLSELFRNNDSIFYSSVFMWKDTDAAPNPQDRLLNLGPLWDFDQSAGNTHNNDNWKTEGCWVSKSPGGWPNWLNKLFDNTDFLNLAIRAGSRSGLHWRSSSTPASTRLFAGWTPPQQRNFATWPISWVPLTNHYCVFDLCRRSRHS